MLGCRPPKYIRALHVTNSTNGPVTLNVKYQSGQEEIIELAPNKTQTVEKDINMGSWTAVDPITAVTANYGNLERALTLDAQGVEVRTYTIVEEGETFDFVRAIEN